jgi:hypothetical protein
MDYTPSGDLIEDVEWKVSVIHYRTQVSVENPDLLFLKLDSRYC